MAQLGGILTTANVNVADDGVTATFANSLNTNDNVQITRTAAGVGDALQIDMGAGAQAVEGAAIIVNMGTGATAAARGIVVDGDSGGAFDYLTFELRDGGTAYYAVDVTGKITRTLPTVAESGSNFAEMIGYNTTGTGAAAASIILGDSDPAGVSSFALGSLYIDAVAPALYQKTGASTWTAFGTGGGTPSLDTVMTAGTPDNTVALAVGAGIGESISLTAAAGAVGAGANGFAGGASVYVAGAGGANDGSSDDGGVGGATTITAGAGGGATGAGRTGGAGGSMVITSGAGGASAAPFAGGAGGDMSIAAGDGGTGSFQGNGGNLNLDAGTSNSSNGTGGSIDINPGQGVSNDGSVTILSDTGLTNGTGMTIGNSTVNPAVNIIGSLDVNFNSVGIPFDVTGGVLVNNPSVRIAHNSTSNATSAEAGVSVSSNVAGTTADPRYPLLLNQTTRNETTDYGEMIQFRINGGATDEASIFLGDGTPNALVTEGEVGSLFIDAVNAALYMKTVAPSTWVAFSTGGGVADLQGAYDGGATIVATVAKPVAISTTTTSDLIDLTRTNTGSGDMIQMSLSPGGETQSGIGIRMTLGSGHTSQGVNISNNATANTAAINVVQGASSTSPALRVFVNGGATGDPIFLTDGTQMTRFDLSDLRVSQSFTISTDDNAGAGPLGGFSITLQPGRGADGTAANDGGFGGGVVMNPFPGGTSVNGIGGGGGGVSATGGAGGVSTSGQCGNGGGLGVLGGPGGAATATSTFAGNGGNNGMVGGPGGAGNGATVGGSGGQGILTGGIGGLAGTGVAGAGGAIAIAGGVGGGVGAGTGAVGGNVTINAGIGTGTAADGSIQIAPTTGTIGFFGVTPVGQSSAYTPTNVTTDRSYNANSTTLNELADVIGTLIADLQATGLLG